MYIVLFIFVSGYLVIFCVLALDRIMTSAVPEIFLSKEQINEILSHIKLDRGDVFYDLGCGDGRVLKLAAINFPKAKLVGVELSFHSYVKAKISLRDNKNVVIRHGSFYRVDLANASHVFMYLLPETLEKLKPKIEKKKLITVEYKIPGLKPDKTIELKNKSKLVSKVYFYNFKK